MNNKIFIFIQFFFYCNILFSQELPDYSADIGTDDCIKIELKSKCGRNIFPFGSNVCFKARADYNYMMDDNKGDCHPSYHSKYKKWLPKYDGILSDQYQYNSSSWNYRSYNTTYYWDHIIPGNYYKGRNFTLTMNVPGDTYVIYTVKGGYFEYGEVAPKGDLKERSAILNYNGAAKLKIRVVKCDEDLNLTDKNDMYLSITDNWKKNNGAGNVTLSSMVFESGNKNEVEAFKTIIFKPGVHIKSGATFHAIALPYPSISGCNCTPDELQLKSEVSTDANFIGYDKEYVKILYLPINQSIEVKGEAGTYIQNVYIYEISGRMLLNESFNNVQNCSISTNTLSQGIYIVQAYTNNGFVSKKVAIR